MNHSSAHKIILLIIIAIYIIIFALNYNRLHYGVEISDEAYYVAEAYIVSNGAIPVTNNWMQAPGGTLLCSPIVRLYTAAFGGTEGIFLFMRKAFLIYKILVAGVLILLLRRSFPFLLSLLLPLPYLALSPFSIDNFSYNTLSLSLLLISCVLLFSALQNSEKYNKQFSFLGGILMALTVFVHPTKLFTAAYIFALLFIFERKRFKSFFCSCLFIIGGALTGIAVTIYLSVLSGGIKPIFNGINMILRSPYHYTQAFGLTYNINVLKGTLTVLRNFLIPGFAIFSGLLLISFVLKKWHRLDMKTIFIVALFFSQILNIMICVYRYSLDYRILPLNISICQVYVLILLLAAAGWKQNITFVLLVFSPFLTTFLLNIPFGWSGLYGRGYILFPSLIISILLTYFALQNIHIPNLTNSQKSVVIYVCAITLTVVFCAPYTIGYYGYIYRDQPIPLLTYKMERGVYKGLYTDEERGRALIHLEDEIKNHTNEHDLVMFRDQAPQAYMMTQARHCTPSTWDMLFYVTAYNNRFIEGYDYTDDFLLQEYFRIAGKEPNKIIYVQDKERLEHLSLWDENYKFNKYIKSHYRQTYANNEDQFAIIVFEKNPV